MKIKKYLENFLDNPRIFRKFLLIVFSIIFSMSIIFSKAKREELIQNYKILSEAVKTITQKSLQDPYFKSPEVEKVKEGE